MSIRILTLGGLGINANGRDLTARFTQARCSALLAYIAVERQARCETLQELFWPEHAPARARRELERQLRALTGLIGKRWVDLRGERVRLLHAVEVDVQSFQVAVDAGDYHVRP